ncbi:hypothetical protein A9P82_08700 [Arachidicoccus ginsenosidimutans]|uniref:hypothetical protein n=1 Tax=Arachidicoccus sp. BS20 TaxID=1850526 RepID=UPI0007F0F39E|nr:hypothetical protein [Arachidicoccus sp. BS20]ANI89363.1 hypothetical protein A9P82_08700 [Arachidicoccus sp. BS20]
MQSFIVNVPDDKEAFFLELMSQLNFEVLDIDEQPLNDDSDEEESSDPFLDWEAERRTIRDSRKKK